VNRLYHPRSFFSLLLTGFIVVALPLIVALLSSIQILDNLAQQSMVAVLRSVNRIDNSKKIVELLKNQERAARLFSVLKEQEHLEVVNNTHAEVATVFRQVLALNLTEELTELLTDLQSKEEQMVNLLNAAPQDQLNTTQALEAALAGYETIAALAAQMERLSSLLLIEEVDILRNQVQDNKTVLIWQVSGLMGFSVLLIALFIALIIRPVHQMDKVIERLGEGDFTTPITVSGPRDLESIGHKLDWLRRRLDALDREKVKMLAHISHELKTPLASIKEGTGLLKDGVVGPLTGQQGEVIAILDSNCRKLQRLIQDILDFNMARAREQPAQLGPVPLAELVSDVMEEYRTILLARNIHLESALPPMTVIAHREQMKAVVDNLLGNAVKFTPDGGTIRVVLTKNEHQAQLWVEDSGPGISDEDKTHIFLPFFQGSQENYSSVKGSGLGLAISKEYLDNFGGSLRQLPGDQLPGARFVATIPLKSSEHFGTNA
jgi:two-component system sensor histidine kinase GlrK